MSWVYEIALRAGPELEEALGGWLVDSARAAFAKLPALSHVDVYRPVQGPSHDPYNDDGAGPLMLLVLDFAGRDALAAFARGDGLAQVLKQLPAQVATAGAAFERRFFPVGDSDKPAPLEAPFSYVVRYHRPADDEAAFVKNYLDTHPVTQARLPGIRAIMCYLPQRDLRAKGVDDPNYMIGNEVVFDHAEDFKVAMASPVREELRAHYREFPRFTGPTTHFPMHRTRLRI